MNLTTRRRVRTFLLRSTTPHLRSIRTRERVMPRHPTTMRTETSSRPQKTKAKTTEMSRNMNKKQRAMPSKNTAMILVRTSQVKRQRVRNTNRKTTTLVNLASKMSSSSKTTAMKNSEKMRATETNTHNL